MAENARATTPRGSRGRTTACSRGVARAIQARRREIMYELLHVQEVPCAALLGDIGIGEGGLATLPAGGVVHRWELVLLDEARPGGCLVVPAVCDKGVPVGCRSCLGAEAGDVVRGLRICRSDVRQVVR